MYNSEGDQMEGKSGYMRDWGLKYARAQNITEYTGENGRHLLKTNKKCELLIRFQNY